jgi:hypothetical protein
MPKNYQKAKPEKSKLNKNPLKTQPTPVNLLKRKSYWITLAITTLAFSFVYGFLMQISLEREALIVGSILSVIGLAFYVGFISPTNYSKRAVFLSAGASIIGFSIWAALVLSLNTVALQLQITRSIGEDLFAITSLVICLVAGAFIGDLIGKNAERIGIIVSGKFRK